MFPWTTNAALGGITLHHLPDVAHTLDVADAHTTHTRGILATSLTVVLASLAHNLGADRAGDCDVSVGVLDVHGRAGRVLVELDLGVICDSLLRLDDVLALGGLHDDATFQIHK